MRIYDTNQEGLLFLSPYVRVCIQSDRLQMVQTLYSYETSLLCTKLDTEKLLRSLVDGIREEKLCSVLEESMDYKEARRLKIGRAHV